MKKTLLSLLCLGVGFLSARWIPGPASPSSVPSPSSSTAESSGKPPLPEKPARSLDLTGDWKSSAEAWAQEDPAAFRDWLVERGEPPGDEVLKALFLEWVKHDLDAAFEGALNLPSDFKQEGYILTDLLNEALKAPAGLAAVLKWAPLVEDQIRSWGSPGEEWLKNTQPEALAAQLKNCKLCSYSASLVTQLGKHWALSDFSAALQWMNCLGPDFHRAGVEGIMATWTEKDPRAALAFLANEASSEERRIAFFPLGKLAETDPRAAMDWWEENVGVTGSNSIGVIFEKWCASNPEEALDYALGMEDPTLRKQTLQEWGASSTLAQVLEAVDASTDPETRTLLLKGQTSDPWSHPESQEALRDLIKNQTYPEITPEMASTLTIPIIGEDHDPAKAFAWAISLPEDFQGPSVYEVITLWMQKDKIAATQAVQNLPEGPSKTAALSILAHP